ncbi:uncharacterized protein LOC121935140 isoform X2 [Sceloporus undulatus]|uniref:uncharacterized protein LOC121935140 isoform X2 n=1 Tax=Sceloporus undulatus TaxID=8520 RepID=UPI001C4DACD3|nr:uncharacterized protein LOC121935140 isoform X2 [Sceloporus undulatus]
MLADCTQFSLIERLKIYLECQLMEKQDLERRVIEAEAAMLEMENAVAVLQRRLQNADYSSTKQMDAPENDVLGLSSSTLLPMEAPSKVQDFDSVSTTSTLPVTSPLSKASDDHYETLYHSSDNPDVCSTSSTLEESVVEDLSVLLHVHALPTGEERHETREGMMVRGQENENSALDIATKKPMDWADPITFKNQAGLLDSGPCEAKPMAKGKVQVTHPAGKDASDDDLLDGGRSLTICFVHASETKMGDLTPEISQAMSIPKNPEETLALINSPMSPSLI